MKTSPRVRLDLVGLLFLAASLAMIALLLSFDLRAGDLQVCPSASALRAQVSWAAFLPTAPSFDAVGAICNS